MAFVLPATHCVRVKRTEVTCSASAFERRVAGAAISASIGIATLLGGAGDASAGVFHFSGSVPPFLGPVDGRYLSACPSTPNCVSTDSAANSASYVPPWTYHAKDNTKPISQAIEEFKTVVLEMKGAKIVEERPVKSKFGSGYYIRAEFTSDFWGFVDDVEALFQPQDVGTAGLEDASGIVDYRSASRLGEGDFNVNRKRIKAIRVALEKSGWKSVGFR